ncbi:MAG: hypothetical protein QM493_01745 [Sulfurovum sp.]
MNIKDDVNFVTKSLSSDEKMLENAFKLETIYKRHKVKIWLLIVIVLGFFITKAILNGIHESKLIKANEAFLTLQTKSDTKSDNSKSIAILKENNPALYELYSYSEAVKNEDIKTLKILSSSKNSIIADISSYNAGILEKKVTDSKVYNDMSLYIDGYLAILNGDKKSAKNKLGLIDERSPLAVVSGFLKHSTIKEK